MFFTPFVDLSQRDKKRKPFSDYYSEDYGCYYECYINGREIRFDHRRKRGFGISLKPGKYDIKIIVYIKHAVGNAYASDMNFSRTSFSYERHIMSSPFWIERKVEKTWNIEVGEYTTRYLGFNGYLNGSFIAGYNQDYYHRKYDDYRELIYRLDYVRENLSFFESTKEEIEKNFDFYMGVLKFDYDNIDLNAKNHILLEMGEYPFSRTTTTTSSPKPTTSTTQTYIKPKTTVTNNLNSTLFSKIKEISSSNSQYISIFGGNYYGNIKGKNGQGVGIKWTSDKINIGFYEDGWQKGYGIEVKTADYSAKICEFDYDTIKKELLSIRNFGFVHTYSTIFDEKTLRFSNGLYTGRIFNNLPNNFGTMLYNDISYYVGEWLNGAPCGIGIYVSSNNIQIGQYSGGKLNGYGIKIYPNDKIEYGKFVNGVKS